MAVEFAIVLMGALALLAPVGEVYRVSLFDQALAQATHAVARAVTADPANCEAAVSRALAENALPRAMLDLNDDGTIGVAFVNELDSKVWPDGSSSQEVQVTIAADNNLFDGVDWEVAGGCGAAGTWLDGNWVEVRSRITVRPWFAPLRALWPDGIRRQHASWARNQG